MASAGLTKLANTTTLAWGTGLTGIEILDFDWSGIEKASVDAASFGLTGGKPMLFSDQYDPGALDITIHFDDTRNELITDLANAMTTADTLVLTFPHTGAGNAATWTCPNAGLVGMGAAGSLDDKITQPLSFKLSGSIAWVDAADV